MDGQPWRRRMPATMTGNGSADRAKSPGALRRHDCLGSSGAWFPEHDGSFLRLNYTER